MNSFNVTTDFKRYEILWGPPVYGKCKIFSKNLSCMLWWWIGERTFLTPFIIKPTGRCHKFFHRIYPPELQLNKANTSDTEAPFLYLHLPISIWFVSSKIYDKGDNFDFDIVNFPFLDGDVPRSISYGVYISQLIRFARVSSHVADFNARD